VSDVNECVLCHTQGHDVRMALLRYQSETGQYYFATDTRCGDHVACRARVEAAGFEWPLVGFRRPKSVAAQ
jgi:hypothetical protein